MNHSECSVSKDLLEEVTAATVKAAEIVASYYKDGFTVKDKGEDNPVTEADLATNDFLAEVLPNLKPEAAWLSEETKDSPERLKHEWVWIVDPLDGTREFTKGIPEFVVSVALVHNQKAYLGVLVNPITKQVFSGLIGHGAYLNGKKIEVTEHHELQGAKLVCSRSEMAKGWFDEYEAQGVTPTAVGSVAYKFGLVAAGLAEATFTPRPRSEWDIAAGVAIVEAAGGRCSDKTGSPYRFNQANILVDGVLASNSHIHDDLLKLM